jgi:ketosteroid isomerase-like protein
MAPTAECPGTTYQGEHVTASSQELYQRYVWASAMTSNADAVAEMFTVDGVIEAPLLAADKLFPQRMQGREEIRSKLAAYYERSGDPGRTVNPQASRYVLHETTDPDVFIVEIDAAFDGPGPGVTTTMSLVQIFRVRDGKIAMLRDYFASHEVE